MKPCVVIPFFDHGTAIAGLLDRLETFGLACWLVDDGSDAAHRAMLEKIVEGRPWVSLERHPENRGKGAALRTGYQAAAAAGYTHAIQLDADGQHDVSDVPILLAAAEQEPSGLVLCEPIFENPPWVRRFGRLISWFWVCIETLSTSIRDPLCGLRSMPLEATLRVLDRHDCGDRMEFDPEIAVRLAWEGIPIVTVPCKVTYIDENVSHFRAFSDNARISWMHTRLVVGMIWRSPRLIARKRVRDSRKSPGTRTASKRAEDRS